MIPHHGGAGPPSRALAIGGGAAVFPDSPLLQFGTDDGKALATGTWQQYVGVRRTVALSAMAGTRPRHPQGPGRAARRELLAALHPSPRTKSLT